MIITIASTTIYITTFLNVHCSPKVILLVIFPEIQEMFQKKYICGVEILLQDEQEKVVSKTFLSLFSFLIVGSLEPSLTTDNNSINGKPKSKGK